MFGKIVSPTTSYERNEREFFQLYPNLCLCERRGKTTSPIEAVLKISIWQKKKQLSS